MGAGGHEMGAGGRAGEADRQAGRVYGGRSLQQRREERRGRLLAAGFDLFGSEGWTGTTIERLCGVAGVATRSFYEEFQSREALLEAVYVQLMDDASDLVVAALAATGPEEGADGPELSALVSRTMRAYLSFMTEDPRRAAIAHREIRVCGALERSRQGVSGHFVDLMLRERGLLALPPPLRRLIATALAGATSEVLVDWVSEPSRRASTDTMVEALSGLYVTVLTGLAPAVPRSEQE